MSVLLLLDVGTMKECGFTDSMIEKYLEQDNEMIQGWILESKFDKQSKEQFMASWQSHQAAK